MIQTQKLKFYELIREFNLDWHRFNFVESKKNDELHIRIEYDNTDCYFRYIMRYGSGLLLNNWQSEYSPGLNYNLIQAEAFGYNFSSILENFKIWLQILIEEIDASNFFERLMYTQLDLSHFDYSNIGYDDRFSKEEEDIIQVRIIAFKKNISDININIEQLHEINQKLDYLIDRSKRLPKIDWINIFISTIVQFTLAGAADLAKNIHFVSYLKELMTSIFNPLKIIS